MGDKMRPVPFEELTERVFSEYRNHGTIFGISSDNFYRSGKHKIDVFGQKCSTPLGPAAGPHTQLAQNIISSYLVGGRFIELKTVQIMDYLGERHMISKPCIDAEDEGYNVEWSSEFTLEKAYDEYLKAWFLLHVIQALFSGKKEEPDFIFNMSVGYSLEGIREKKMQTFIDGLIDARKNPLFEEYRERLKFMIADGDFYAGTDLEVNSKALDGLCDRISPEICRSVTISTMHGCPPQEIESICSYMLREKHLNTFVKLNPTLLGFDAVSGILMKTGFSNVVLKRESFDHDLQYKDAVEMIKRLLSVAEKEKLGFGVKLTNTLGNVNDSSVLPGEEKYMSGRALLPISVAVAAKLSREFDGKLKISYCGGASAFTVKDLFDTGIRPITVATDMLKPGGYSRMFQMVGILEKQSKKWADGPIDVQALEKYAAEVTDAPYAKKDFRFEKEKAAGKLDLFDCFVSPCMQACPIHQDIPDYISLAGRGQYADALSVIYGENALPNITCNICDRKCQKHCARIDYEGPVQIRQIKKIAVEKGCRQLSGEFEAPQYFSDLKASVVGAGPAGLSAAYYLARSGFDTTVFEKRKNAGGVVANIIPSFRIDEKAVRADIDFIEKLGVKFVYGVKQQDVCVDSLKKNGFDYIFYAVGCEKDKLLKIDGPSEKMFGATDFLEKFRAGSLKPGKNVVVCGGGNTAIDCARSAKRCAGVENVTVMYRRTENEMPADTEEYLEAKKEGISFVFLANPVSLSDGRLKCTRMVLGEVDSSGRRSPVDTGECFETPCDTVVSAVGEYMDPELPGQLGISSIDAETFKTDVPGVFAIGDMTTGPSTVVRCMASARKAVETVLEDIPDEDVEDCDCGHCHDCHCEDCDDCPDCDEEDEEYLEAEEGFYADIVKRKTHLFTDCPDCSDSDGFAEREAQRCMDCKYLCTRCVDVCPNRANVAIDMRFSEYSEDPYQILHIDAFCNECGNCATFCNHCGKPYRDKFTLFSTEEDFKNSENSGFYAENDEVYVRMGKEVSLCRVDGDGKIIGGVPPLVRDLIEQVFLCYDYLLTRVED